MQPLEKNLRNQLERVVKDARDIAEQAARIALEQLGIGAAVAYPHLNDPQKELRRRLRAHGRQLGDQLNTYTQIQDISRLVEEVAYEHWHRMLFAKFLAENHLLMYPDPDGPVAITLEECEDLAAEEGARNGWELASRFAAHMLPQIFRVNSPVLQLILPLEYQQQLEKMLASLDQEVFQASDSLGWVYQFWQSKKKEAVNNSEVKIGAQELPAVTQLFTEPYMVHFLLDNSLGSWWAARRLIETDFQTAEDEIDLRQKASITGVPLYYLRFVQSEEGNWTPAAGKFEQWPDSLKEFKLMDPCCGSGHFLVAAFHMLVPMRMELEGLTARESVDVVFRENIHGLELDQRCVELAAFALALNAWSYPHAGGYRVLPNLNIACSGLSVSVAKEEWKQLAMGKHNLRIAMDWMYETFKDAPTLGSLINPTKSEAAKLVPWSELSITIEQALAQEESAEQEEAAVIAYGLTKTAKILSAKYNLVITNVPYLVRGKQSEVLRAFCETYYPEAKNDLATVFLDRCIEFSAVGGCISVVLPQNWLFLTSYKSFREKLLRNNTWNMIARLGPQAFQTPMWDFNIQMLNISNNQQKQSDICKFESTSIDDTQILGIDASTLRTISSKEETLRCAKLFKINQRKQLDNPDSRISFDDASSDKLLNEISHSHHGLVCGDRPRMCVNFWEIVRTLNIWIPYCGTVNRVMFYGGKDTYLRWCEGTGAIKELKGATNLETHAWKKKGVVISAMGNLYATIYTGMAFDNNTSVITSNDDSVLPSIWSYCSSLNYYNDVRTVDQSLKVTNATLVKVPFNLKHWIKVAEDKYPNGLPKPFSDDPTQWIYHGHPCGSVLWSDEQKWTVHGSLRNDQTVLQVAVARLLGYRWPAEIDPSMELASEQREWINCCESLLLFADKDGIVCIPPVRGERSAADRLVDVLAASYGETWSSSILANLLADADHAGKSLESWLRDKFFVQHCKLFQHRPFIWQIWDGLRDGFSVLVNYHKLDKKLLETLIYTYLGDWINRQNQDIANQVDGAQERLAAAERLKKCLELILEGDIPYDIFIRWKSLANQPIGWDPDINDGVRLNIRPFMSVPDVGKKGAGILRDKPNINWNKDRGQDVESSPWYKIFNGDRINDYHLTLAEKRKAQSGM